MLRITATAEFTNVNDAMKYVNELNKNKTDTIVCERIDGDVIESPNYFASNLAAIKEHATKSGDLRTVNVDWTKIGHPFSRTDESNTPYAGLCELCNNHRTSAIHL